MKRDPFSLLRGALRANALFSVVTGFALFALARPLGATLGLPVLPLAAVGLILFPFAYCVFRAARRFPLSVGEVRIIIALDLAWVAGSAGWLVADWLPLTRAAFWTVFGIAEAVLLLAVLQAIGLARGRRIGRDGVHGRPRPS